MPILLKILLPVLLFFSGIFGGYVMKDYFFPDVQNCPICEKCPPQTVYLIHNDKIKKKGKGDLNLYNYMKVMDSLTVKSKDNE